jgi:D-arabinose 1-dehydrogenase-like Zn-dependent alcohol dehydrogenase
MAKKMRAAQIPHAQGQFEIVERDIPEPQAGWIRVKVEACGVCHSDSLTKEGHWPGIAKLTGREEEVIAGVP